MQSGSVLLFCALLLVSELELQMKDGDILCTSHTFIALQNSKKKWSASVLVHLRWSHNNYSLTWMYTWMWAWIGLGWAGAGGGARNAISRIE